MQPKVHNALWKNVQLHNKKTGVRECKFDTGVFMFRAKIQNHTTNKLSAIWIGPLRVKYCLSNHLYETEDIRSRKVQVVHGSRLKLFRNKDYNSAEVLEHLAYQDGDYCVVDLSLDIRHRGVIDEHLFFLQGI